MIYLVSCTKEKLDHATPAAELYISPWFKKARRHVQYRKADWRILSAKHGLVHPATVIEPYDDALHTMYAPQRRRWAAKVLHQLLIDERGAVPVDDLEIVILAGRLYREFLLGELRHYGALVSVPLDGMGIGQQLAWFTAHEAASCPGKP